MTEPAEQKAPRTTTTLAAVRARLCNVHDLTQGEVDKLLAALRRRRQDDETNSGN